MSIFDRAVKALNDVDDYIDYLADNESYVTALEAAGLLAPDLPEPDSHDEHGWPVYGSDEYKTYFSKHPCKGIPYLSTPLSPWMDAESARKEAYRLLAAVEWLDNWDKEHAERNTHHGQPK